MRSKGAIDQLVPTLLPREPFSELGEVNRTMITKILNKPTLDHRNSSLEGCGSCR
jgi:hypothetical protein